MKRYIIIQFIVIQYLTSIAQGEGNNWLIVGDNYISFNTGSPVLITPPPGECGLWEQAYCDFFQSDLCGSSISDKDGNLLLYSNGDIIFNAAFDTLLILNNSILGNEQSSQCMFIKKPGNNKRYYLFTTSFIFTGTGVRYTEIDLNLNNGLGGAIVPYYNVFISQACQKVTGVYHANGRDIWVLVHQFNSNAFYAFLVTEAGINFTPVVSNMGSVHEDPSVWTGNIWNNGSAGEMKFSPNSKKVAVAVKGLDLFEIFDFDNNSGIVSNPISFSLEGAESVEFSPDGTVAYVGDNAEFNNALDSAHVYQIDLMAGDSSSIVNSFSLIAPLGSYLSYYLCYLQLAPDGKIYMVNGGINSSWNTDMSIIQSPNLVGNACNFDFLALVFPPSYSGSGMIQQLPNFFRSWLDRNIVFSGGCLGDTTMIYTQTNDNFDSIRWVFSNPLTGISYSIPNQDTVFEYFSQPGAYPISLLRYRNEMLDSTGRMLFIKPNANFSFPDDTTICEGQQLSFQLSSPYCQYAWVNNFNSDTVFGGSINISTPGKWWPVLTNYDDYCGNLDTFSLSVQPDILDLGPNGAPNCILNPVLLDAGLPGNCTYQWSTGDTTASILATDNGYYMVTVQQNYCTVYDTILIAYDDPIQIELFDTLSFCDSLTAILDAGDYPADFLWSPTGETTAAIVTTIPGLYTVTATNACGSETDSTLVQFFQTPSVNLGNDTALCFGDTLWLHNLQSGAFEPGIFEWSTGATLSQIPITGAGSYSLTFTNICGSDADTVVYGLEFPLLVNLGNDTILCVGSSIVLGTTSAGPYLWSPNGETTATIVVSDPDIYSLSVSNACGTFSDTVSVVQEFPLVLNLGMDTAICTGDSVFLQNQTLLPPDPGTFLWSTGDNSTSIYVMGAGQYSLSISNACGTFSDSLQIIVDTALSIDLGNDTTICLGENLLLHSPYSTYSSYLWSTGETGASITVFNQSNYSLSVSNACGTYSDSLYMEVHENLFAFPFDTLLLPSGQTITIDAGAGYASYFWSNDSTSQSITVGNLGLYWVEVEDSIGCVGSDTVEVVVIDGIQESTAFKNIKVYPNPVKDELVISFGTTRYNRAVAMLPIGGYEIYLFNSLGQKIATRTPTLSGSAGSAPAATETFALSEGFGCSIIDFSGFPKGIYLLSISRGNEKMVVKVVKE